jgi:hypothetical protein
MRPVTGDRALFLQSVPEAHRIGPETHFRDIR